MTITIRKSQDRGHFDYDWLNTYHTFSFGSYNDPQHMGFRSLRVVNEDRIKPGVGFPLHKHHDMEIFSLVIEGGLAHQDDMGNGSVLRPGHVQLMSAGKGVTHTESNASDIEPVYFFQIWILPKVKHLEPTYQEMSFPDSAKQNKWGLIISPDGHQNTLKIHQDVDVYLSQLDQGVELVRDIATNRYGWLQVIKGQVKLNEQTLMEGDGAAISQVDQIKVKAEQSSQLFFIDLN